MALCGCEPTGDIDAPPIGGPNPPGEQAPQTDRISQLASASTDVLFVIDNSSSMGPHQETLNAQLPAFLTAMQGGEVDFHVGVISTDMSDSAHSGRLQEDPWSHLLFVDPGVSEPIPVLQRMAELGVSGSPNEQGRAAIYTALATLADADNAGFARDDASISIVVISDEDDYSGESLIALPDFIAWLSNYKPNLEMVNFNSIVGPTGGCWGTVEAGEQYIAVTDAVGGVPSSICDSDWDDAILELGQQSAGLETEFFLSAIPVELGVVVWVEEGGTRTDFVADLDYIYDRTRNSIAFTYYVPPAGAEVFIQYELLTN